MKKNIKGFSLIETLVVVIVFAVLAGATAQSVALSLRSAHKSDQVSEVRDNFDFAISIIERELRNSQTITSSCTGSPALIGPSNAPGVQYEDEDGISHAIYCQNVGSNGYIYADISGSLTNEDIAITACEFTCNKSGDGLPESIYISMSGELKDSPSAAQASPLTVDTIVRLRVY